MLQIQKSEKMLIVTQLATILPKWKEYVQSLSIRFKIWPYRMLKQNSYNFHTWFLRGIQLRSAESFSYIFIG